MNTPPTQEVDEYSYPLHMTGTASPLQHDAEPDPAERMYEVVREITGQDLAPKRPRMGFLP